MGGGLMQLVAYGAQDIYLTGNPQITFFKVVYRRHTNFSMEAIQQTLTGSVGNGNRVTTTVSRNGDLLGRMYLQVARGAITNVNSCANYGSALVDEVELEIGGQQIDKQYGHWMEVYSELTQKVRGGVATQGQEAAGAKFSDLFRTTTGMGGVLGAADPDVNDDAIDGVATNAELYVPLQFWFCRNPGLYLPLIALQYHEVKVKLTFQTATKGPTLGTDIKLFADYVYLDTDERRRFAQVSHEYLIEQVQHEQVSAATSSDLNFNHPVKELIWSGVGGNAGPTAGDSTPTAITAGSSWTIKLNGHDRFEPRPLTYFTRCQVLDHHSGDGGRVPVVANTDDASQLFGVVNTDSIAVYSFALKPEEHQPSGTCNFSRIDNAKLTSPNVALDVYAVNYNVLRIMSGMGGLAYSN